MSHLEFLSFSCPRCHPNFSHPLQVGKAFLHMFCLQKKDSFHRAKSYLNKKWNHLCQLSAGANVCFWKSYCVQKTVVTAAALPASCCSFHKNGDFRLFFKALKRKRCWQSLEWEFTFKCTEWWASFHLLAESGNETFLAAKRFLFSWVTLVYRVT